VRKIAKEHGIDIQQLNGTGISGRVTKKDITAFIESGGAKGASARPVAGARQGGVPPPPPAFQPGESVRIEKMGVDEIRKYGAMDKLTSDNAKAEISARVKDVLRTLNIDDWQSEPYKGNQNFAKRGWRDTKRKVNSLLNLSGADPAA
jgi:hypothetical protein